MTINNPFLSPAQKLGIEMQIEMKQLENGNLEIKKARARAEVAFQEAKRSGHWDDQPFDISAWSGVPPSELPSYWAAGVRFTATWVLGYAQAAAKTIREPEHFEHLLAHCVSALAASSFNEKLNRYARVSLSRLDLIICHFRNAVLQVLAKPFDDLRSEVWQRYRDRLEATPIPGIKVQGPDSSATLNGSVSAADPSQMTIEPGVACSSTLPDPDVIATRWEDLLIRFTSDHQVQITIGKRSEVRTYEEMGFRDARTGNPNSAWHTLRKLAENGGLLRDGTTAGANWTSVEKRIQAIRKTLRGLYGFEGDPVPILKGIGYRTRFIITCSRGY